MHSKFVFVSLLFILLAVPLYGVDITLTVRNQDRVISTEVPDRSTTDLSAGLHSLRLVCDGVSCAGISVAVDTTPICEVSGNDTSCDGTIRPSDFTSAAALVVRRNTNTIYSATIRPPINTSPSIPPPTDQDIPLSDLLKTSCAAAIASELSQLNLDDADPAESGTYFRRTDRATFVVDVVGNVHAVPTENVDENDQVTVRVFADNRLLRFLRVRRKSAIRTPANRNVGEGLTIPRSLAQSVSGPGRCESRDFVLDDFNPGKGEVEIRAQVDAQTQSLETFEFLVNPLYNGMFSLGTATSELTDREFKLRTVEDKKFIYATAEGDTTRYVVYFTPFLNARDIEKSGQPFWEHINPTFGISTQETAKNAFAGISIDYKGFVVSGGWHFSQINGLASSSGLKEGDAFVGAEADIPQAERWDNDSFIGVSIDLRSAVALFQTLVSGTGGGS